MTRQDQRIAVLYEKLGLLEFERRVRAKQVLKGMSITLPEQSPEVARNREIEINRVYNLHYREKRRPIICEINALESQLN